MEAKRIAAAMEKAAIYINGLTINSKENIPEKVLGSTERFFTWDNEKRSPRTKTFLYDYSYYNGVVMEGLYDIYEAAPEKGKAYYSYVKSYLDGLMEQKEDGGWQLNFERSGYVDCHGADCYKTAALFERFSKGGDAYGEITDTLYRHLTDESYVNSLGHTPCLENMPEDLGHNYWHGWREAPKYKIWLDGIYMLQPFLTRHAVKIGDRRQLELVQERLDQIKAIKKLAAPIRVELAQYRELASFAQFGSDLDASTKEQLAQGERIREILKQDQYNTMPVEKQVIVIYAATKKFLLDIAVDKILEFEKGLFEFIDMKYPEIPQDIKNTKELTEETEQKLIQAIKEFKADFVK